MASYALMSASAAMVWVFCKQEYVLCFTTVDNAQGLSADSPFTWSQLYRQSDIVYACRILRQAHHKGAPDPASLQVIIVDGCIAEWTLALRTSQGFVNLFWPLSYSQT